jgi:hypothetical protein
MIYWDVFVFGYFMIISKNSAYYSCLRYSSSVRVTNRALTQVLLCLSISFFEDKTSRQTKHRYR